MKSYYSKRWSFDETVKTVEKEQRSFLFWSWETEVVYETPKYKTKEELMAEVNRFILENNANVITMTDTARFVRYTCIDYGCDDYEVVGRTGEVNITYWVDRDETSKAAN